MPTPQELETKFWQALKSDMTMKRLWFVPGVAEQVEGSPPF